MERRPSIFDSHSEFRTFRLLESVWGSDYLISDHLPVRNVLGFERVSRHLIYQNATSGTCYPLISISSSALKIKVNH